MYELGELLSEAQPGTDSGPLREVRGWGPHLVHGRAGQEEAEPSASSSGEGPHFSTLSILSLKGSSWSFCTPPPGLPQTAFFLLVLIPSPKDHRFSTPSPFSGPTLLTTSTSSLAHFPIVAGPARKGHKTLGLASLNTPC